MAEEDKIERKPPASLVKGMSLYASSADYERRLSEDCVQAPGADMLEESERESK